MQINIAVKIDRIVNHPEYKGDFGGPCEDEKLIFDKVIEIIEFFPKEYREFIKKYGSGELAASFFVEMGPIPIREIYGRDDGPLNGMYIFATDQSEYVYAFDSKNNFQVVDIDASGEVFKNYGTFSDFIEEILDKIIRY